MIPRRGCWPLVEKRTSFMGDGLLVQNVPPIIAVVEFTRCWSVCYHRNSRNCFSGSPPGADNSFLRNIGRRMALMKTGVRLLAVVVSLLTLLAGPFAPLAAGQQTPPWQPGRPPPAPGTSADARADHDAAAAPAHARADHHARARPGGVAYRGSRRVQRRRG